MKTSFVESARKRIFNIFSPSEIISTTPVAKPTIMTHFLLAENNPLNEATNQMKPAHGEANTRAILTADHSKSRRDSTEKPADWLDIAMKLAA